MKAKINYCKNNNNTKLCTRKGFFDKNGWYREARTDSVVLGSLPKEAIREVTVGHDITIRIRPKKDIVVFAKNAHDMDKYAEIMGEDSVKGLLEALSKYNDPEEGNLWATYDFPVEI